MPPAALYEGRAVIVSSHVLEEVERFGSNVVVIAQGRLVHSSSLAELAALAEPSVRVTSPDVAGLQRLIAGAGWADRVEPAAVGQEGVAVIHRVSAPEIGARAFAAGLELHELVPTAVSTPDAFPQSRLALPATPADALRRSSGDRRSLRLSHTGDRLMRFSE